MLGGFLAAGITAVATVGGAAASMMSADAQAAAAGQATAAGDRITKEQIQLAGQARDNANVYQQPYYNQGTAANNKLGYLLGTSNRVDTPVDNTYDAFRATMTSNKSSLQSQLAQLQSTRPNPKNKKAFASWQKQKQKLTQKQKWVNTNLSKDSSSVEFKKWQERTPGIKSTELPIDSTYGSLLQDNPEKFNFEADPGYKHRLEQGNNALSSRLAGMGMLDSGAAVKEAVRYNQGEANQTFGDAWQRYLNRNDMFNQNRSYKLGALSGMAASGQQAAGQMSNNENIYGSNVTSAKSNQNQYTQSNINAAGNARSAGIVGAGNAIQSGAGNYLTYAGRKSGASGLQPSGTYKNLEAQGVMF
jgi:hypothetical protein